MRFHVESERIDAHLSQSLCKSVRIGLDTDMAGNPDAFNPAELLLAALSACMIKGIERVVPIQTHGRVIERLTRLGCGFLLCPCGTGWGGRTFGCGGQRSWWRRCTGLSRMGFVSANLVKGQIVFEVKDHACWGQLTQ